MKTRLNHRFRHRRSGLCSYPLALCHDELSVIADYRRSQSGELVTASVGP